MDNNLSFFSLPFVDSESADLIFNIKNKSQYVGFDDIQNTLPSQGALLGAEDVFAQFLSADEPLDEPDLNGPTTLHCEICRKKFDNAKKYYGHLRVHSKDNLWACDKCPDLRFATKQQLMKHRLTHKPLQRVWKCQQCSIAFEALWRLQQHLLAKHMDSRKHKCHQCPKSFFKLSDLKKHKEMHSDVKLFKCPTCDTGFKDKSNLKRHMARHNDERPYSCTGCANKFKQLASMKRHCQNCIAYQNQGNPVSSKSRKHYCRVCGKAFQYQSSLLEHCVRQHTISTENINEKVKEHEKPNQTDRTGNEDNIVEDILSAEDDYMSISHQNEVLNVYNNQNETSYQNEMNNLMQIEMLKDMNPMHSLDYELFYNDIDLDSFQNNHLFNLNTNDIDYNMNADVKTSEVIFDYVDGVKCGDHNVMNNLHHQVKSSGFTDELLNVSETIGYSSKPNELIENPAVSVNECATIFESDVDLEASTHLAANLNQLIGENNVQYISTEDDDTFIISLNSAIDAEQLTDMLNINAEIHRDTDSTNNEKASKIDNTLAPVTNEPVVVTIAQPAITTIPMDSGTQSENNNNKIVRKVKVKKQVLYVCRTCSKVFKRKDNYMSHRAVHVASLRRHKCRECSRRFAYRSSLNKHRQRHRAEPPRTAHPHPPAPYACTQCDNTYTAAWKLKNHMERFHQKLTPYKCDVEECDLKFYKKSDLVVHMRFHTRERPYACETCKRTFRQVSHLNRHKRQVDCTRFINKDKNKKTSKKSIKEPAVVVGSS